MTRFCSSCGFEISGEFKFCPQCGVELISITQNNENEIEKVDNGDEVLICENCGEENPVSTEVCISCGAKLTGENIKVQKRNEPKPELKVNKIVEEQAAKTKVKNIHQKTATKKHIKHDRKIAAPNQNKMLDSKKIILGISAGVIIIFILLVLTGKINLSGSEEVAQNNVVQESSSGVDLNNVQKINELESQVKAAPNNIQLLLQLAHLKNDSGFYDKAIIDYTHYLEVNPSDADARIDMGVCYYNLQNYPKAIEEMQKALTYQPTHQIAHLNLGVVTMASGDLETAKQWLEKAVKLNPNTDAGKRAQELLSSH